MHKLKMNSYMKKCSENMLKMITTNYKNEIIISFSMFAFAVYAFML